MKHLSRIMHTSSTTVQHVMNIDEAGCDTRDATQEKAGYQGEAARCLTLILPTMAAQWFKVIDWIETWRSCVPLVLVMFCLVRCLWAYGYSVVAVI